MQPEQAVFEQYRFERPSDWLRSRRLARSVDAGPQASGGTCLGHARQCDCPGLDGVLTFTEPEVTAAVRFIREHACEGIRVRNVVERSFLSQRQLERLFQHYLGRSLKAELLRIQIEKAQQLLAETDLPVKTIAIRTGFRSEQYFSEAFFRQCGLRPTVYRQHHRASPEPLCSRG